MELPQAAQFDGPMNSKIAKVAKDSYSRGYSYPDYLLYAKTWGITALSRQEYENLQISDVNDRILVQHWDSNILFNQRNHTE
jgi:hypothetical protein